MAHLPRDDRDAAGHWFTDSTGVAWCVREVPRITTDLRRMVTLVFESSMSFRRVSDFPPNWRDLTDQQLEELSWHR